MASTSVKQKQSKHRGKTRRPRFDNARLRRSPITAVDLFCGAGGLTHGLLRAGIKVEAGIDADPETKHAYLMNNAGAQFYQWDVERKSSRHVEKLFAPGKYRLLAGCAPCQPFSKLTNGMKRHRSWDLLKNFGRYIKKLRPDLVTMENVPELAYRGSKVFDGFVETLRRHGYNVDWQVVNCADYGAPQSRKRLVLIGSLLGPIAVPKGRHTKPEQRRTVRQAIGHLSAVRPGKSDPADRLHIAAELSARNLQRIRATPQNGGTKDDWPEALKLKCHQKKKGKRYHSIYGRMWWHKPAPTITTLCNGLGNGRFGHPRQNRAITLREAALLQTFPECYDFWPCAETLKVKAVARMIGNAVPPELARALGNALLQHVRAHEATRRERGTS